jgi:hypothetical protein
MSAPCRLCGRGSLPSVSTSRNAQALLLGKPLTVWGEGRIHTLLRISGLRGYPPQLARRAGALPFAIADALNPGETWALLAGCAAAGQVKEETKDS